MSARKLPQPSSETPANADPEKLSFSETDVRWRRLRDTLNRAASLSKSLRMLEHVRLEGSIREDEDDPDSAFVGLAEIIEELLHGAESAAEGLIRDPCPRLYDPGLGLAAGIKGPFRQYPFREPPESRSSSSLAHRSYRA